MTVIKTVGTVEKLVGREFKLNINRARKFYRAVLDGNTLTNASAQIGVSKDTTNLWRAEGRKHDRYCAYELDECMLRCGNDAAKRRFFINVNKALALAEAKYVSRLDKATSLPINGNLTLEVLARRNPKEWGKKNELNINHSGTVHEKKTISVNMEPAQRLKIGSYLMERAKLQLESGTTGEEFDEAEVLEED